MFVVELRLRRMLVPVFFDFSCASALVDLGGSSLANMRVSGLRCGFPSSASIPVWQTFQNRLHAAQGNDPRDSLQATRRPSRPSSQFPEVLQWSYCRDYRGNLHLPSMCREHSARKFNDLSEYLDERTEYAFATQSLHERCIVVHFRPSRCERFAILSLW